MVTLTAKGSVFDVALYILERLGPMSAMKLEKLVYYCQAWASGPIVPELYAEHRGKFMVHPDDIPGDPGNLDTEAKETIDAVT